MTLKMKYDEENQNNQHVAPLGSDEIKSILKTQSESVFQDKNISNNSNFVKKSLIDIALDFETKEDNSENKGSTENDEKINELKIKQTEAGDATDNYEKNEDNENILNPEETALSDDITEAKEIFDEDEFKNDVDNNQQDTLTNEEPSQDENEELSTNSNQIENEEFSQKSEDKKSDQNSISDPKTDIEETKQALDSVRNAVSQSIIKSDNETYQTFEENQQTSNEISETIKKDLESFKNVFSSLSNLTEKAIYKVFENKILDIANELAGYQIDKMPEKFEKKIKSFLKNINCFQDKITIEVNDKDYEALSKIEDFNNDNEKSIFSPNEEIARGDIILNCEGMYYSEKTIKKK